MLRGLVLVSAVVLAAGGCGDNISFGGPDGGSDDCGNGVVDPGETCDDGGACCVGCQLAEFGVSCRESSGECDAAEVCDGIGTECPEDLAAADGTACSTGFCSGGECTECDPAIDMDFDGADQCADCNDTNGLVFPGADETCNGVDDDCDGAIDEDFDADGDTYSVCSTDPLLRDCDDSNADVNPGATEDCGGDDMGNGLDDDCDGFVDETCQPCDDVDDDGDGMSECDGDCDDGNDSVNPGAAETCDGLDTDCNRFTQQNCGVSDPCNFPDDADVCGEDLLCGCVLDGNGRCNGNFRCSSFCQGSFTGPLSAGCEATQVCQFRVTLSDNQHGCAETTATLGAKLAGETCANDTECRSGSCDTLCTGPGCQQKRCVDFCDHHEPGAPGSCAAGTVCEPVALGFPSPARFASCRLDDNGPAGTGEACGPGCIWGSNSCVGGVCAEPCGTDSHCPDSFHCSLDGNRTTVGSWGVGADVPASVTGQPAIETVPVCLADSGPGAHDRGAGAACDQNSDCASEFCDANLGVCVSLCVTDASCPPGLGCEPSYVRTPPGDGNGVVFARVCANQTLDGFYERQ